MIWRAIKRYLSSFPSKLIVHFEKKEDAEYFAKLLS
jgi:hypothetical protein